MVARWRKHLEEPPLYITQRNSQLSRGLSKWVDLGFARGLCVSILNGPCLSFNYCDSL